MRNSDPITRRHRSETGLRERLDRACNETLAAFAGLREVERGNGDLVVVFRALRHVPRAQEALYPLAVRFPPVSSFFFTMRYAARVNSPR